MSDHNTIDNALSELEKALKRKEEAKELYRHAEQDCKRVLSHKEAIVNASTAELDILKGAYKRAFQQLLIAREKVEEAEKVIAEMNAIHEYINARKDQIFNLLDAVSSNPNRGILPRTLIMTMVPLSAIGQLPLSIDDVNPDEFLNIFTKYYLKFVVVASTSRLDGSTTDGMVELHEKKVIRGEIDLAAIQEDLQLGNDYLVERDAVVKMLQKYWASSTKVYEAHINSVTEKSDDHRGVYQGITFESTKGMWKWLSEHPLVRNLVGIHGLINVVDAGSGLNAPCIIGAYLTGIINMGIGIEGDKHKACMAAKFAHS